MPTGKGLYMDLYIENDDLIPVSGWINKQLPPASLLEERKAFGKIHSFRLIEINRL
jgi:hypothetical protein